jgi:hypothetical protein
VPTEKPAELQGLRPPHHRTISSPTFLLCYLFFLVLPVAGTGADLWIMVWRSVGARGSYRPAEPSARPRVRDGWRRRWGRRSNGSGGGAERRRSKYERESERNRKKSKKRRGGEEVEEHHEPMIRGRNHISVTQPLASNKVDRKQSAVIDSGCWISQFVIFAFSSFQNTSFGFFAVCISKSRRAERESIAKTCSFTAHRRVLHLPFGIGGLCVRQSCSCASTGHCGSIGTVSARRGLPAPPRPSC